MVNNYPDTPGNLLPAPPNASDTYTGSATGYPTPPKYNSWLNPDGSLASGFQLNAQPAVASFMPQFQGMFDQSRGALDSLSKYANGATGTSPWAMAQYADLDNQTAQAKGRVGNQVNASTAAAGDAAASRGGLSSAMRASLARNAQKQGIDARAGISGQALNSRNQITTGDADRQLGVLSQLPGQENARLGIWSGAAQANQANDQNQQRYNTLVDQQNIKNRLAGISGQNDYNMNLYSEGIKRQAGTEQANATANAGKK